MTEPGAGSDLKAIRTTAVRDGDHYVVNGSKTFHHQRFLRRHDRVGVKTDPKGRCQGVSLLIVDLRTASVSRWGGCSTRWASTPRHLRAVVRVDVKLPVSNLFGEEGRASVS
ncbi:hypothetical protein GS493_21720 [Rhodococcus hoagii]|nr:hypothetical protein [Prescottella equi]